MRLVMNGVKCSALVGMLGVSVWALGCGESSTGSSLRGGKANGSIAPAKTNGDVDLPLDKDSGTAEPAEAAKPDGDAKPEGEAKPVDPDAKPADTPADSAEDKKTEGAAESK